PRPHKHYSGSFVFILFSSIGPIDGEIGPGTRNAIRSFRARQGLLVANLFRRFPLPRVGYRVLDWEESNPPSFYALAFTVSYQVRALFTELRAIARPSFTAIIIKDSQLCAVDCLAAPAAVKRIGCDASLRLRLDKHAFYNGLHSSKDALHKVQITRLACVNQSDNHKIVYASILMDVVLGSVGITVFCC